LKLIFLDNYLYWVVGLTRIKTPGEAVKFQAAKHALFQIDEIDAVAGRYIDRNHTLKSGVELPVRIYYPQFFEAERKKPYNAFVWFHGGGWTTGHYSDFDRFLTGVTNSSNDIIIFSVDYRLAPKFKYPTGLNDCWDHLLFLNDHAKDYNIDSMRIIIGGEDAGGNFAAVLAQRAKKDKHVKLAGQYLCAPFVLNSNETESYRKYSKGYILTQLLSTLLLRLMRLSRRENCQRFSRHSRRVLRDFLLHSFILLNMIG